MHAIKIIEDPAERNGGTDESRRPDGIAIASA